MSPLVLVGIAGGALLLLGSGTSKKSKNPIESIQGMPLGGAKTPEGYYQSISKLQGWGEQVHTAPTALTKQVWSSQNAEFEKRWNTVRKYLSTLNPEDAKNAFGGAAPEKHSKQSFLIYRPGNFQTGAFGPEQWGWYLTDEFGRPYEGWGYGGSAFGQVLQLAQTALPLVPGIGTAAAFGLGAAIAVGQGKSLKDAALAGVRASLPPYAQIAFDIGVGVANGQKIDEASLNALEKQYPGSKAAYQKGKQVYGSLS